MIGASFLPKEGQNMYVDAFIRKDKMYAAERINGRRVLTEFDPVYEYFVEDKHGTVDTIRGTKAVKKTFILLLRCVTLSNVTRA